MMFSCPNDSPSQIVMNLHSGAVLTRNLHPNYVIQEHALQILDKAVVPLRLTRNIQSFLGEYYEEGSFKFSIEALALTFKKNEDYMLPYMKVLEKKNLDLVTRGRILIERELSDSFKNCLDVLMRRGSQYAPLIEGKIDSRELVDKELREAMRRSKDLSLLVQANPSFCAWF